MILTNELDTVSSINEAWLRESLEGEANAINSRTDTHMEVYNSRPNHFMVVVDDSLEYILDTTEYTAELTQHVSIFNDGNLETLLIAVVDDSDNFEDKLATNVISAIYETL